MHDAFAARAQARGPRSALQGPGRGLEPVYRTPRHAPAPRAHRVLHAGGVAVRRPLLNRGDHAAVQLPASLGHRASFDLDFHLLPYPGDQALWPKPLVSKRSRRQRGVRTLLAQDTEARGFSYAKGPLRKENQNEAGLRLVDYGKTRPGTGPRELAPIHRLPKPGPAHREGPRLPYGSTSTSTPGRRNTVARSPSPTSVGPTARPALKTDRSRCAPIQTGSDRG